LYKQKAAEFTGGLSEQHAPLMKTAHFNPLLHSVPNMGHLL